MNFRHLAVKGLEKLKEQSPTILSILGVIGVVTTTALAIKATPKALLLIEGKKQQLWEEDKPTDLSAVDYVKVAGRCYISTITIGLITVGCILMSNGISKRQQASIAGAYIFLDNAFKKYKKKVAEMYGQEGEKKVEEELAKDVYAEKKPVAKTQGTQLFYEENFGDYFEVSELDVEKAKHSLNRIYTINGFATLNDFFELLHLPQTDRGNFVGWTFQTGAEGGYVWIDFDDEIVEMDDGLECHILKFRNPPTDESGEFAYDREIKEYFDLYKNKVENEDA